jgi:hypothetical protein
MRPRALQQARPQQPHPHTQPQHNPNGYPSQQSMQYEQEMMIKQQQIIQQQRQQLLQEKQQQQMSQTQPPSTPIEQEDAEKSGDAPVAEEKSLAVVAEENTATVVAEEEKAAPTSASVVEHEVPKESVGAPEQTASEELAESAAVEGVVEHDEQQ